MKKTKLNDKITRIELPSFCGFDDINELLKEEYNQDIIVTMEKNVCVYCLTKEVKDVEEAIDSVLCELDY